MNTQEEWAEREASQFDKIADSIAENIQGWQKSCHPDSLHMATVCAIKSATWREAARSLRQPYRVRIEREGSE